MHLNHNHNVVVFFKRLIAVLSQEDGPRLIINSGVVIGCLLVEMDEVTPRSHIYLLGKLIRVQFEGPDDRLS